MDRYIARSNNRAPNYTGMNARGVHSAPTRTGPGNLGLMEVNRTNTHTNNHSNNHNKRTSYYGVLHRVDGRLTNRNGKICFHLHGMIYYGAARYHDGRHNYSAAAAEPEGHYRAKMKWYQVDNHQLLIDQSRLSFQLYHVGSGQSHFFQMNGRQDFLRVQQDLTARLQRYPRPQQQPQQQPAPVYNPASTNPPTSKKRAPPSNPTGTTNFAAAASSNSPLRHPPNNATGSTVFAAAAAVARSTNAPNNTPMYSRQEVDALFEMMDRRLKEVEKQKGIDANFCRLPWRSIGKQSVARKDKKIGGRDGSFKLPEDVYSILATWSWKSKPFWMSMVVVFGFQMSLMILVVIDALSGADQSNPLNLPVNVEEEVRIAQGLAVIVAMVSQDDLRVGIEGFIQALPDSFRGNQRFQGINKLQWHMAYLIRFLQGFMGVFTSFILLMQANTIIEVLLNFLGVAFISELDDRFFALGALGYLGNANLRCTEEISRAEFYRDETKHPRGKRCSPSWFRKSMHVLGVFVVLIAMIGCYLNFTFEQKEGTYSIDSFLVEFGDQTVPSLGLFNGCYESGDDGEKASAGRIVYSLVSRAGTGTFSFCSEMNRWTFYDSTIGDECEDYIVKSDITRTFDIMEAGNLQWYTEEDEPLEFLKLSVVERCESKSLVAPDACKELELEGTLHESRSRYYDAVESAEDTDPRDPTLSHAIYVGKATSEIVLFTGRRWVITDAERLSSKSRNYNLTNASDIEKFFFTDELFQVKEQDKNWISFISEEVSSVEDQGTPLGLRWYFPRYEEGYAYNFSSADLSRPADSIFACARCDNNSNPCNYGGTCLANGTCLCANGAYGELCREKPLGNGKCNPYFNEAVHDYDGGDCCGSTCEGGLCGTPTSFNPFGLKNVTVNPDAFDEYSEDYGTILGIVADSSFVKRYECQDPGMATFTIEVSNMKGASWYGEDVDSIGCTFGSISIRCDDKLYLQTPAMLFPGNSYQCNQSHVERVHVPYGAKCELTLVDPIFIEGYGFDYGVALYYGNSTNSTAIWENQVGGGAVSMDVPKSKCLTDVLSATAVDVFYRSSASGAAVKRLATDGLSDYQCNKDPDMVKERYFLTLLDQSVSFPSTAWDLHQCQGWGFPVVTIKCTENNTRVTSLVTSGTLERPTGGTLPIEVSFLSHLETIDLGRIKLNGTIPTELGHLTALNELRLWGNDLTGTIPKELGDLTVLMSLDLFSNDLTGKIPTELGKLTALTGMGLSYNDLTGQIPRELGKLTALTDLSLGDNYLNGPIPSELGNLKALNGLHLDYNDLSGTIPKKLGDLTALTVLALHDNDLTGQIPGQLVNLTALTQLLLQGNDLTGQIPSQLGNLTALTYLGLRRNDLMGTIPTELDYLTALASLWLSSNDLSGRIPSELGLTLTALSWLELHENDLTGPIPIGILPLMISKPERFSGNKGLTLPTDIGLLTDTTQINFISFNLGGSIPSEMGLMTRLKRLNLRSNDLFGPIPKELGDLTGLTSLYLQNNDLNNTIPNELGNLTALTRLCLSENNLSGLIAQELGNLKALRELLLSDNDISGTIPTDLGMLQQLEVLSLHKNSLNGPIPEDLGDLTALHELSLSINDLSGPIPSALANLQGWPGQFPNASNAITINIRTDLWPDETSFEWSKRNESGLWQVLEFENPSNDSSIHSYTKEVPSDALYKLEIFDKGGNGISNGWFTITNSTPSPHFDEGTLVWEESGSTLEDSSVVFIWVDSSGHAQVVEHIPGEGFALDGGDVILTPENAKNFSLMGFLAGQEDQFEVGERVINTDSSVKADIGGPKARNIFAHD